MPKTYVKFYVDQGGVVREVIIKDDEVKFYINHEKVDIDTYTKVMGNDVPEMVPFLNDWKKQLESKAEPEPDYVAVDFKTGIEHGYHYGSVIVLDEVGEQIDFDFEDSELGDMLNYAREGCTWFIPTSEYKKIKPVDTKTKGVY